MLLVDIVEFDVFDMCMFVCFVVGVYVVINLIGVLYGGCGMLYGLGFVCVYVVLLVVFVMVCIEVGVWCLLYMSVFGVDLYGVSMY